MLFIDAIRKYQETEDRAAFDMIREALDYDYLRSPTGMTFDKPEMYVAFRCLRLISGRLSTVKYTLAEYGINTQRDTPEVVFAEYAATIQDWTRIKLTPENFRQHEGFLRGYLPNYLELERAYERIIGERETLWQMLAKREIEENWPALQDALKYALKRVDTSRSEREIIRYINRATRTAYYRSQFEGMRRVRRGGETRYVTPKYYGPMYAIFGRANFNLGPITRRQRALIDRIIAVIEEDYANNEMGNYAVDLRGGYRIKNRYIAGRFGVHEASLSRTLARIKDVKH